VTPVPPATPAVQVFDAGGLPAETAALLLGGQQGGSLLFEALALPVGIGGRIPFWLEIDGTDLLADQRSPTLQLEIYAYAVTGDSSVVDAQLKVATFDLARVGNRIARSGVKVSGLLEVGAGDLSLRILVRNRETRSVGLRILPLQVTGKALRREAVLPPLISDPADSWLEIDLRPADAGTTLWQGDGPSTRPVVVAGREVEFTLLSAALPPTAKWVLDVMRFDGTPVTRIAVRSGSRERAAAAGWNRSPATFSTDDLGPGDYSVRLLREDGDSVWSAPLPIHVLVHPYDHDVVWAELTGSTQTLQFGARDEGGDESTGAHLALPTDAIRKGYFDSLTLLAEGRFEASIRALSDLETDALAGSGVALDRLRKVEMKITRGLARDDPELLLPILQLYQGLYEQKYQQRQYLISTHARRMLMALIDLYTHLGDPATARPVASSFLAALAARLQAAGMPAFSSEIFSRALQLDAENRISLLCLATGFERRGMYPEATEYLRRLVAADPEHWEGRLRLALNLERNHHFDEAEPLLHGILAASTVDWVTTVAYQELAAAYLRRKRVANAEEIVLQALERFPNDQKLRFLNAFLLESDGDPAAARAALDGLVDPGAPTPSPRYKYSRLPADDLADDRTALDGLAQAELPELATALARRRPRGAS